MNIDRKLRTPARLLMAVPVAALTLSLAACGANRPTADQVSDGLTKYFEDAGMADTLPESAADCYAGYLVDSDLSNETLTYIANGEDKASSTEDASLTKQILVDNATECAA